MEHRRKNKEQIQNLRQVTIPNSERCRRDRMIGKRGRFVEQ